jgi:hypothetical protein
MSTFVNLALLLFGFSILSISKLVGSSGSGEVDVFNPASASRAIVLNINSLSNASYSVSSDLGPFLIHSSRSAANSF